MKTITKDLVKTFDFDDIYKLWLDTRFECFSREEIILLFERMIECEAEEEALFSCTENSCGYAEEGTYDGEIETEVDEDGEPVFIM